MHVGYHLHLSRFLPERGDDEVWVLVRRFVAPVILIVIVAGPLGGDGFVETVFRLSKAVLTKVDPKSGGGRTASTVTISPKVKPR